MVIVKIAAYTVLVLLLEMPDSVKLSLISSFAAMSDSRNYFCSKSSPFLISRHFAHADLILHYRTISSGSLSGTLSAFARLSKIEFFTINFTNISGTLPTEFAGLGIFTSLVPPIATSRSRRMTGVMG